MSQRSKAYIAIIGDIVGSRKLERSPRARLQLRFEKLLARLNRKYAGHLSSKLSITLGDEFQGILHAAEPIPALLWDIESGFAEDKHGRRFRIGLGYGVLYTPIREYSAKMDGPALHNARAAIRDAGAHSFSGEVFNGFGGLDPILNGLSHILWFQRSRWTAQQRKVIDRLRSGKSQSAVARQLKVSRQSISKHAIAAGWQSYGEAEDAWRAILRTCVDEGAALTLKGAR
jgi:hypothetical protein